MTAPMTPSRLEEIRREMTSGDGWTGDAFAQRAELFAEVERLRALPVMDACNRCDDCVPTDHDSGEAACTHPKIGERAVVANAAPPSWCPLRGGTR